MKVCFYVDSNIWFEGNKDQFMGWLELKEMPKSGDEILFKWSKSKFKIISMSEEITGTISIYSQTKFD